MRNPFNAEQKMVEQMDASAGRAGRLDKWHEPFILAAKDAAQALVDEGVIPENEYRKDLEWVESEQKRRFVEGTPQEREHPTKTEATVAVMKFFDEDDFESQRGLEVLPVFDFDRLKTGIRFLLTRNDQALGIEIDTVANAKIFEMLTEQRAKALERGDVAELMTEDLKYIEDDNIRKKVVPKIRLIFKREEVEKYAKAILGSDQVGSLTESEKNFKRDVKNEIDVQLSTYSAALERLVSGGKFGIRIDKATTEKLKQCLKRLNSFKEAFRK